MKRFPLILIALMGLFLGFASCGSDEEEDSWRETNEEWFNQQKNLQEGGRNYYKLVTATWDSRAQVLLHWFNDTMLTRNNLKPLYSSTVDVKYKGWIYDGTPFDSSYLRKSPADSLMRFTINLDVIEGWGVALTQMHVGDSCRVVIPYSLAYGSTSRGTIIKPYSMLVFDIKLANIYKYETQNNR